MAEEIKMPSLSQTTDEVKLLKWLVKAGDQVKKGDILCEVETDKVNMDVESYTDGIVLKLAVEPDNMVSSGEVIAIVGKRGEKTDDKTSVEENTIKKDIKRGEETISERQRPDTEIDNEIKATRLVKNLAARDRIDLADIKGTGPRGIITRDDLDDYKRNRKQLGKKHDKKVIELSSNQLAVTANLTKSKKEIPHYYLNTKVIADRLLETKKSKNISIYSLMISAIARVLKDFSRLNSTFKEGRVHIASSINVGFAVAKDTELFVPVIKDADCLDLAIIDRKVKELVEKVKNQDLSLDDVSGGTVTVSNLGVYSVDSFYGVINYPQALLITIAKINKELFIEDDNSMIVRNTFNLSASFDHRVANGALAAMFLTGLKKNIEEEI